MNDLVVHDDNRVRTIVLARESMLNAFDRALYADLTAALRSAAEDPTVAVVILTGRGRAFSAGQDMSDMASIGEAVQGETPVDESLSGFPGLIDALEVFPKPLIAAVNGLGVGLGFTILPHCDLVLMSADARLRVPFCPLGVAPEAASSALLPMTMGWQHAAWVLFSGEWIDAAQAVKTGVAWRVCAPDALQDEAREVAAAIAKWPIPSLVATKRAMLAGRAELVKSARRQEDAAFSELIGTAANIEAVTAFLEKRTPDFTDIPGA